MERFLITLSAVVVAILIASCDLKAVFQKAALLFFFATSEKPSRLLNENDLSRYNGESGRQGVYLSILGQVFDVTKGQKHYGPGGGYHFLAGKDASRAFVTGDFTEAGLTDDVSGLSPSQVVALYDWLAFYEKDYKFIGKLIGRYYSEDGQPTETLRQVEALLAEGLKMKAEADEDHKRFPSCNSEWSAAGGGRVWCTTLSGGVHRNWAGVPRKMYYPGATNSRCVCVQNEEFAQTDSLILQEYEGCPPSAESCFI